jgi:hypothetical protein
MQISLDSMPWMRRQRGIFRVPAWYCILAAVSVITLLNLSRHQVPPSNNSTTRNNDCGDLHRGLEGLEGVDFLWQGDCNPRAIFFVAHGCNHKMTDWWPRHENVCNECIGLPEEMAIVQMALRQKLVVVAASSKRTCWSSQNLASTASNDDANDDGPRVAKIIRALQQQFPNEPPILAFGASSGGMFVSSTLPHALASSGSPNTRLCGFISQIMATPTPMSIPGAAVWITMNRDQRTDLHAKELVHELQQEGKTAVHMRLPPRPITPDFFASRIPGISKEKSRRIVGALGDFLDNDGFLKDDPRRSTWRTVLQRFASPDDSLAADKSPLSEVLNVAWGTHELARDGVEEALAVLLQNLDRCSDK